MTFANTSLTVDPVWPWSLPGIGLPGLGVAALVLTVLTVLTYLVGQRLRFRRLLAILGLRLGALLIVFLLLLRPSLAQQDDAVIPSKLLILADASQSMNIGDEFNGQSRWDRARQLLRGAGVQDLLKKLQEEQKVEIVFYQGAEGVRKFDLDGKADGKRTNMGLWLNTLVKDHAGEKDLRGLLLFTDGADNGTQFPTLEEAVRWRALPCPLHPFALGSPATTPRLRDIAFVPDQIQVNPSPAPVKSKLTVKGVLNAPGFENARVTLRLNLDDKEASPARDETLLKSAGNEVEMTCDAPAKPGEYKVTLKVDPLPGEVTTVNNEISTYVTVTKEGLSVLWVEGKKRAFESVFVIRHALSRDPRFRVYYAERLNEGKEPGKADLFDFKKQHYDVIVIGDVSAKRFAGGNAEVFKQIQEMVRTRGTGLLMIGGYETFANSDWPTVPEMVELLPVKLNVPGQVDGPVKMLPTAEGLSHYLLRLAEGRQDNQSIWETLLGTLDGMTRLGTPKQGATVLATRDGQEPLLVGTQFGEGRVLAFGGDTTWKAWRRSPEMIPAYERFWRQVVLWLAKQEDIGGNVWVKPDTRRLAAGNNNPLHFSMGVRGKTGLPAKDVRLTAKVIGPHKDETEVPTFLEGGKERGSFWKTAAPGEYLIVVDGTGKDVDGSVVSGTALAKVLAYAEDLENLRPAADHDFLAKLASAGGGKMHLAGESELQKFLTELHQQPVPQSRPKAELWPDWRRDPASTSVGDQLSSLWATMLLPGFVVFCTLICLEWYFRRRWGMV